MDSSIPLSFNGFKIVFIADIHHSPAFSRERIKRIVQKINSLKPDMILLGGDYVEIDPRFIKPCFEELKNLEAPYGKYGVLGNHDYLSDPELTIRCMEEAQIKNLDNKGLWIFKNTDRIRLGGVGDLWNDNQDIDATIKETRENDFVILLSHNPDFVERMSTNKVDLVLSGHTHGGQVSLFHFWTPFHPSSYGEKYLSGLTRTEYTKVLVTNGIGYLGNHRFRFCARPQINVIYLKRGERI